tara:strand:+ start:105 stop:920 length:816 start_codon:yes stop_codon:yes gene_type:complete
MQKSRRHGGDDSMLVKDNKKKAKAILDEIGISSKEETSKIEKAVDSIGRSIGSFTLNYDSPRGVKYSLDVARYGLHTKAVHIIAKSKEKIVKQIKGKEAVGHMDFFYTIEGDETHYKDSEVEYLVDGKQVDKMEASKSISNNGGNIPITKLDSILFSDKFYALMPKNKDKKTKSYSGGDVHNFNEIATDLLENDEAIYIKGLVLAKGYTNQTNAVIYPVKNSSGRYGLRMKTFIAKVEDSKFYISSKIDNIQSNVPTGNTIDMSSEIEVEL